MNSRRGRLPRRDARPLRCPPSLLRASGIETRSGGVRIFIDGFLSPKVPSTPAVFARVANKGVRGVKARKSGNSKEEVAAPFASPWCVRLVCASLVMFGGPQTTRELETGGDQQRLQALAVRISLTGTGGRLPCTEGLSNRPGPCQVGFCTESHRANEKNYCQGLDENRKVRILTNGSGVVEPAGASQSGRRSVFPAQEQAKASSRSYSEVLYEHRIERSRASRGAT